ncbi:MAG: PBP1A family penicillin-binding protein [Nitrospinae bacterium]|nr:PBP1A family penicillin-binding protein [Nitrospinota bacterium]
MNKAIAYIFSFFSFIFYSITTLLLLSVTFLIGLFFYFSSEIPQIPTDLKSINLSTPTEIYSDDNMLIAAYGTRSYISLDRVSKYFQQAIVSIEDNRFYEHHGIDKLGIIRAMYINIKSKRLKQGGSTITQQLAKNLFFSFKQTFKRKILEMMAAIQFEEMFTKDEILQAYSNQIYFGSGAYGIEDASKRFFNKHASELTLGEAAMLAGLPNAPSMFNPYQNLELTKKRQKKVLSSMVENGYIDTDQMNIALAEPLELNKNLRARVQYPYFVDYVLAKTEKIFGKDPLYFGGLKIHTTLDRKLQEVAETSIKEQTEWAEKVINKEDFTIQGASAGVEPKTGYVKFLVGGRDYIESSYNRAISSNRQTGSGFKPFLYYTAIEKLNYTPATVVRDEKVTFKIKGSKDWTPQNYEKEYFGDLILKKALMKSINVISAKLIDAVGPEALIENARKFGIQSDLQPHLSLALGTASVSPLEMAAAYAVFASEGLYAEPIVIKRIESFNGDVLLENVPRPKRMFPRDKIYLLIDMMKGVIEGGTGAGAKRYGLKVPAAGKTGTSNNFVDSWFNGYTPGLSISTWLGDDGNKPMLFARNRGITGASGALPIWSKIMVAATMNNAYQDFPIPEGIRFETVNIRTGIPQELSTNENPALKVALTTDSLIQLLKSLEKVDEIIEDDIEKETTENSLKAD